MNILTMPQDINENGKKREKNVIPPPPHFLFYFITLL